jgi:hypothetical protein
VKTKVQQPFTPHPLPLTGLGQELPLILLNENFDARLELLNVVFLEEPHVSLDPIRIVDPLFLHHSTDTLVLANQQGHRIPPLASCAKTMLVCFVYLVDLVYLVSFIQPNKRNRPNKHNNGLLLLAAFLSTLRGIPL